MSLTGEIPVVRSHHAREAYEDLQDAIAAAGSTPCAPEEAIQVALSTHDWTDETPLNREAKKLCRGCKVVLECRAYAIAAREPHGVWGGLLPAERSAVIRSQEANRW